MQESLLHYYERELTYLRQLGQEFAQAYPKIASRLQLEAGKCEDPHVERLIQAFALLAARIHHKIDDEFPEMTDALLGLLYPHYLAPIPSMSIVQFVLDPEQGKLTTGFLLDRGTRLYSRPVSGTQCRFRTCYPVTLWPIEVKSAQFEEPDHTAPGGKDAAMVRLELQCQGGTKFQELELDRLRFYLHGESQLVQALYELLLNNVREVRIRAAEGKAGRKSVVLPTGCLQPVGFGEDEGLLPYSTRSFLGYRLLQEYFTFPQKFLFLDLRGLRQAADAGIQEKFEVLIALDRAPTPEQSGISASTFRLGCAPIANLFEQLAEPIRLDHTQREYMVIPDIRRAQAYEVYSIDAVTWSAPHLTGVREVEPFYSLKHAGRDDAREAYWFVSRRPSARKGDSGTDVWLSLVDLNFDPALPAAETLSVQITATNRDLPGKLPFDEERGDFELEGAAPVARIRALVKPTPTVRLPLTGEHQWRLVSHLSLNYLSLVDGGVDALQEILKLYDFSGSSVVRQHIEGITNVRSRSVVRRPSSLSWSGLCRGVEVDLEFDEKKYVGSGVFLFASVLERFFALYSSINSFTQLVATSQQREEPIKRWPPRVGEQILL